MTDRGVATPSRRPVRTLRVIAGALRTGRRWLVAASALAVLHQLCEVAVPVMVGVIVDQAIKPGDGRALAWSIAGLVALFGVRAAAGCLQWPLRTQAMLATAQSVRMSVVDHGLNPTGSTVPAGRQLSLASSDADAVGQSVTAVVFLVSGLAAVIAASALLVATSPMFGLLVVVALPVALMAARLAAVPLERRTAVKQQEAAAATELVTDLCRGLRVLRGIDAGTAASSRYRAQSARARLATERSARTLGLFEGISEAATGLLAVSVVWLGGRAVADGDLTIGELVAVVGLVTYLAGQTYRFTEAVGHNATARASAGRVAAIPQSAPPPGRRRTPRQKAGTGDSVELRLRGVSSGPLKAVDLHIRATGIVAIVCTSATDADELIDVLACDKAPERGAYLIDGIDVVDLDIESVRATVLVAPHEAVLLGSSVRASVQATARGDIDEAMRASGADEVIEALPGGADAPIGERGQALSGGQRQRVALARALAAEPAVLVLRDPTTAVDTVTEARIASRLRDARAKQSTVLVASSPALLAAADRVVLIDRGRVIAASDHETLLRTEAIYRAAVLW